MESRTPRPAETSQALPAPQFPKSTHNIPHQPLLTPLKDPEDIVDDRKYTRRRLQIAQKPIPGLDLGEDEEVLDPEVQAPIEEDFIKPPPLEELVDPTKIKQTFIPRPRRTDQTAKANQHPYP